MRRLADALHRRYGSPTRPGDLDAKPDALPIQLTDVGSRRSLPLPAGRSAADLLGMLATLSIENAPASELRNYLYEDFERFVHTWGLTRGLEGRCLEIGSNPYFTTVLMREFSDLSLTLTNFFGASASPDHQQVSYRKIDDDEARTHELEFHVVNVESDRFPFDDDEFDVVLFCEVIEHLLEDPIAALLEIKRVLRPGGQLILTTPNVGRFENVARLVAGANIYDPYSGHGPYGRHNREYTRHELNELLTFVGFDATEHFTADVHAWPAGVHSAADSLAAAVSHRLSDLGQYLFFRAINARPARSGRPDFTYRSRHDIVPT